MPPKKEKKENIIPLPTTKYYYGVGRRKRATAQVRIYEQGSGKVVINNRKFEDFFPGFELRAIVTDPLVVLGKEKQFDMTVVVKGGGKNGQAESIRLGVARALETSDKALRPTLKTAGYLKRDPRSRERKKPGLKRARRAPQWSKR